MQLEDWQQGGFGLYVHWPFCEAKCPYCDFNSHVVRQIDQKRWADALAQEVRRVARLVPHRVLNSVFFGGGTPSLMLPETVETVLQAARDSWHWANDIEITLEANPRSVEAARFEGYARAGVNRVSLGVQSLRDQDLRRLGRMHDSREARAAFEMAKSVFDRVSFDLIYARQGQGLDDWRSELLEALDMSVDHLSLYQLTIEDGTAFGDRYAAGKLRGLPDENLSAEMYEMTWATCQAAGYKGYEVSNFARAGAESRHNLIYWRYGDYAGVGPGAHGRLTVDGRKFSTVAESAPKRWMDLVAAKSGDIQTDQLTLDEQSIEYLIMGLRLTEGIQLARLKTRSPGWDLSQPIAHLQEMGLLWSESDRIGATAKGRLLLNAVIAELVPG